MAKKKNQPPGQTHPEGGYGERGREANRERVQHSEQHRDGGANDADSSGHQHHEGGHKIYEDRQQHDEADKNAEKNRLNRDRDRGVTGPGDYGRTSQ
jgi:hypothetical protein